jgi:hypothetical protein
VNVVGRAPAESHGLVAGDVDDQGTWCHVRKVVVCQERERRISVLEHAVDDDVVLGEELCKAHPAVLRDRVAHSRRGVVAVEVDEPCGVNRCGHGRDFTMGEDVDVMHCMAWSTEQ